MRVRRTDCRDFVPAVVCCALSFAATCAGCAGEQGGLGEPNQLLIEAQQLVSEGQIDQAIEKLDASIAGGPTIWSLRLRAKLLAERGEDEGARRDCEAALQLAPDDPDVLWIQKELDKPAGQRFQGAFQEPPSKSR